MFVGDKLRPNAILIEYIPNMQEVNLSNFSMKHLLKLRHILEEIHRARVRHGDPYPRNMMIVPGSPGRALWIDFDRAQTFPENVPLSERQSKWFQHEARMVEYFANALVCFSPFARYFAADQRPGSRPCGRRITARIWVLL